jgi:KDO2-lipid IV(A) lauroyltransferase
MNNIIVYLIIFLTRLISIIPRNFFINNFFIKKIFEIGLKKRRKIISANINHCFSDKDSKWRDKLVKDTCDESIGAIFDNNLAWNATTKKIKSLDYKIRGIELLDEAKKNNMGVLLLFRHNLYIELSARILSLHHELHAMERPNNSKIIQKVQEKGRLKSVENLIPNSDINNLIELLRNGKIILYGPDQDYRNKRSIVSTFFGQKCLTTTVPFSITKITNCNLFYFDFFRNEGCYELIISDISSALDSKEFFAKKLNEKIEESILKKPQQYLWHHRRFKSQKPEIYD